MMVESFRTYLKEILKSLEKKDATEHTHRPALKTFIESLVPKIEATNEPAHTAVGAPDFNVRRQKKLIGHVECKDVGADLGAALKTDQLKRYRENLPNLLFTDYLNFIWFRNGAKIDEAHIARFDSKGRLQLDTEALPRLQQLLENFLKVEPPEIGDPRKLAEEMARPAREIRETIREIFKQEGEGGSLHAQLAAFRESLLPELTPHDFADMYAQTIAYGLFAAKTEELILDANQFTWEQAFHHLPKSNPFLQSLFGNMMSPDNKEPRVIPWVEELAVLIGRADMRKILADFGKRTRQEDPVVHFYETFLGAYDPAMKKARGIYFTPEPVVSYIVRSVDYLLKEKFGKKLGLADENVYILDPACGTGSFLLETVKLIKDRIPEAAWPDYVRRKLLPRLFGFELLVAPYTIAHLKLGLYLKDTGFEFTGEERLGVFLTNTLEPEVHGQLGFARVIAEEGKRAQKVKKEEPIMVVLGNPPYSYQSENTGAWITELVRDYYQVNGQPLGERNPRGLQDDYVKFLRFAQWRIEQTGYGIVGMITNHGYLDNPTFRGMRQQLTNAFNEIYLVDLHGNANKKEICSDGSKDENVFDIQQGVAIGIFTKEEGNRKNAKVNHSELWGLRDAKYAILAEMDVENVKKKKLTPSAPFYLFVPQNTSLSAEYERGKSISTLFLINSAGLITARDSFSIRNTKAEIWKLLNDFVSLSSVEAQKKYNLSDTQEWRTDLAQKDVKNSGPIQKRLVEILYRPFDIQNTYYTGNPRGFHSRPRNELMKHMLAGKNLGLVTVRQVAEGIFNHILVTDTIIDNRLTLSNKGYAHLFPLYLYPTPKKGQQEMHAEEIKDRKPNLAPEFIAELEKKLGVTFIPSPHPSPGGRGEYITPEDVFYYIYAVLYSPTYRSRYAEFLKIDFPRVPLTSSLPLFRKLVSRGKELVELHLMESAKLDPSTSGVDLNAHQEFKNEVVKVSYDEKHKRVSINKGQRFSGIEPAVWNFHVGGYQVCEKWLKDRKGRKLNYDDITHYQKIVIALRETIKLMAEIDKLIPSWPIE